MKSRLSVRLLMGAILGGTTVPFRGLIVVLHIAS
jgi:hypothetical protein